MRFIKSFLIHMITYPIYLIGCLAYNKKYLTGIFFNKDKLSKGWFWIIKYGFTQKILRFNSHVPFPVPPFISIANPDNIIFDNDDIINFHNIGCYFQAINAHIYIGKGTMIAPNCGIITTNHDFYDISKSQKGKDIYFGKNCWIGMNSMILPGVELGDKTIVGAGSVVTKSYSEGNCILVGNPAKIIRKLEDHHD